MCWETTSTCAIHQTKCPLVKKADTDVSGTPCVGSSTRGLGLGREDPSSSAQITHFYSQDAKLRILENVTGGEIQSITEESLIKTKCSYQSIITHPAEPRFAFQGISHMMHGTCLTKGVFLSFSASRPGLVRISSRSLYVYKVLALSSVRKVLYCTSPVCIQLLLILNMAFDWWLP